MSANDFLSLVAHPATPAPMVSGIDASVAFQPDGSLHFAYRLRGDVARVRVPPPAPAARAVSLWEHTCFEAFVGVRGESAYREFNFSPSGQWAAYAFADYRQREEGREIVPDGVAPRIVARCSEGRLELDAVLPASALPPSPEGMGWSIGLCAVIEAADAVDPGYWALKHVLPQPDFHRRESFVLELVPGAWVKPE